MIKINNMKSSVLELKRGVKQEGVMSGSLFNFFLDDLIQRMLFIRFWCDFL